MKHRESTPMNQLIAIKKELCLVGCMILVFCSTPHSKAEIADYCGYKNNKNFTKKYLRPLLDSGTLKMTIPNKPNTRNQKYITVRTE